MQTKSVKLAEIYGVMKEMLDKGGTVDFNPRGTSMLPTLHNDGDRVILKKFTKLKKYDLPLYLRDNGQFVLHRVHKVNKDGTYNMCGDNQWHIEKNVRSDQIIGTVVKINRGGKTFSTNNPIYRLYVLFWVKIRPLRHIFIGGTKKVLKCLNKK
ncbi:MAG: S24/S26 family peptidase [Clostridia bacterium]|nr:S24/S26 family peptidase [Clostridia bacterium]